MSEVMLSMVLFGLACTAVWLMCAVYLLRVGRGRHSYYTTGVYVVSMALATSTFWTLVFYPAVMPYDALNLWEQALNHRYDAWHPPALALLLHTTQQFTDQPDLIGFMQGGYFWASLFVLIRQVSMSPRWFVVMTVLVILVPSLWLYSNAVTSNAWMAGSLFLSTSCVIQAVRKEESWWFWLAVIWFSTAVMFRREAMVLLPLFLLFFYRYFRLPGKRLKNTACALLIAFLGVAPASAIDLLPQVEMSTKSSAAHGLLNQYVGILVRVEAAWDPQRRNAERLEIDNAFGVGTFDNLIKRYNCRVANYISVGLGPVIPDGIHWNMMPFIATKVVQAAFHHPTEFVAHNLCYYGHLLQLSKVVYQHWGVLKKNVLIKFLRKKYGIPFNSKTPTVKEGYITTVNSFLAGLPRSLLFSHFWLLMVTSAVGVWGLNSGRRELWVPALFAVVYPLGFFIFGPASAWRYLIFTHACGWVCCFAGLQHMVIHVKSRWHTHRTIDQAH